LKTPKFERVHTKNRLGALPQTPSRNRGATSKGKGGEGMEREGRGRIEEGKEDPVNVRWLRTWVSTTTSR